MNWCKKGTQSLLHLSPAINNARIEPLSQINDYKGLQIPDRRKFPEIGHLKSRNRTVLPNLRFTQPADDYSYQPNVNMPKVPNSSVMALLVMAPYTLIPLTLPALAGHGNSGRMLTMLVPGGTLSSK